MRYDDFLYSTIDIPHEVWKLFGYPELVRLRGISQAVLPVECNPFCTAANRFQHGLGVWWLGELVCRNRKFRHLHPHLSLAGLLHDAGNPPFSHLSEPFLHSATGHDGETYLREVLPDSKLAQELESLGADLDLICDLVSGSRRPFSDLLCGSLDLDNLDNVARYYGLRGNGGLSFNPEQVACAFTYFEPEGRIVLNESMRGQVQSWKAVRKSLYHGVYSDPHLALAIMLFRAVGLAFKAEELPGIFWKYTDRQALEWLKLHCNYGSRQLVSLVERLQPFACVIRWSGSQEPEKDLVWSGWEVRENMADHISDILGCESWQVAVYVGKGRDVKPVSVPFWNGVGGLTYDEDREAPVWRVRIYVHPQVASQLNIQRPDPLDLLRVISKKLQPVT